MVYNLWLTIIGMESSVVGVRFRDHMTRIEEMSTTISTNLLHEAELTRSDQCNAGLLEKLNNALPACP